MEPFARVRARKFRSRCIGFGAVLCVALVAISGARADDRPNVIAAGAGYFFYTNRADDLTRLDGAFNGEFTAERELVPGLALRAGIGYFHDGHEGDDLRGYPVTLTAIGFYPRGRSRYFAGIGVGAYPMRFAGMIEDTFVAERGTKLGGHLLFGASRDVGPSGFVAVEAKYLLLGELPLNLLRLDLGGLTLTTFIGFRY